MPAAPGWAGAVADELEGEGRMAGRPRLERARRGGCNAPAGEGGRRHRFGRDPQDEADRLRGTGRQCQPAACRQIEPWSLSVQLQEHAAGSPRSQGIGAGFQQGEFVRQDGEQQMAGIDAEGGKTMPARPPASPFDGSRSQPDKGAAILQHQESGGRRTGPVLQGRVDFVQPPIGRRCRRYGGGRHHGRGREGRLGCHAPCSCFVLIMARAGVKSSM